MMTKWKSTLFGIVGILPLAAASPAHAFHDGGCGPCEGCHVMHDQNGQGNNTYILLGTTSSSVCLNCHQGTTAAYDVATPDAALAPGIPPSLMSPGGDFAWLKKSYTWVEGTSTLTEDGERHGHNIVAPDFGYLADTTYQTAPGGTYPSNELGCTSCHDPHGIYRVRSDGSVATTGPPIAGSGSYSVNGVPSNPDTSQSVGTYCMLAGIGYKMAGTNVPAFIYDAPAAMAPSDYNRSEAVTQTRVAYGNGISLWCENCHPGYHSTAGTSGLTHPTDVTLGTAIAAQYNAYVKTGDLTGDGTKAFLSLVPFGSPLGNTPTDRDTLASMAHSDDSDLNGPSAQDLVNCLTCHRAHASGWDHMLRWNNDATQIVYNGTWPGTDNGAPSQYSMGRTSTETQRAYYDRPATVFATNQAPLCEKCHSTIP